MLRRFAPFVPSASARSAFVLALTVLAVGAVGLRDGRAESPPTSADPPREHLPDPTTPAAPDPDLAERLDAHVRGYVEREGFRGVVLVARDGRPIYQAAYGPADEARGVPNTVDTRFMVGSLTKSLTATAVMRLVEAGALDLDAPVATYVPGLRADLAEGLTLHRLLKHQSGLPRHLERLVPFGAADVSSGEVLAIINRTPRRSFAPGTAYDYSNLNYHLAALAIEAVTGLPFADALRDLVFEPVGMARSGVERQATAPADRAAGYRERLGVLRRDENVASYALGSGDAYATAGDLLAWDRALSGTDFLSAASTALLFDGEGADFGHYGYGFRIREYQRGPSAVGHGTLARHGGSMDGFLSNVHRYLDDRLTVIVLANRRPFPIRRLTFELKELALGVEVGARSAERYE